MLSTAGCGHRIFSALPSRLSRCDASPKAISGRTSYLRVRLEFHPLATSHPPTFQRGSVRSSIGSYPDFNLLMARSPGFGSTTSDYFALLRLAFAAAPHLLLNLAC